MTKEERQQKFLLEHPKWTYESALQYVFHPRTNKQLFGLAASVERWRQKYPERTKAHRKVFVAMRNGALKKKPCFCGTTKVEAHHPDYSKPLKIKWLCKKHHILADKKRRKLDKIVIPKRNV